MRRLSCLTFTAIALLIGAQLAAAAPPSIGILLDGKGLSAETELSIRDAISPSGLSVLNRDNLKAAMAFAPKGAKGWDRDSLTALMNASGASQLLYVQLKSISRNKSALRVQLVGADGTASRVVSVRNAELESALKKTVEELLALPATSSGNRPPTTNRAVPVKKVAAAPSVRTRPAKPGTTKAAKGTLQRGPPQVVGPYSYCIQMGLGGLMSMPDSSFFAAADFFVTGGMRRGLQAGLQSTMFIDGGVFQHWLLAGFGDNRHRGTNVFFGVGLAGNHGLNITNSLQMVLLMTLGKPRPNKFTITYGFSGLTNFSSGAGYVLVTLGASYGN